MRTSRLYTVRGMVQGVGFRYYTLRVAQEIGVTGYVRNRHDGTVEVYATGTESQLDELKKMLHRGPSGSRVDDVFENSAAYDPSYLDFEIEH